jgi:hypothetical protein
MVSLRGSKYGSRVAMTCSNPSLIIRPGAPAMAMPPPARAYAVNGYGYGYGYSNGNGHGHGYGNGSRHGGAYR